MNGNPIVVKVTIQGDSYTLKTDQDEEIAQEAARLVDSQLAAVLSGTSGRDERAAVVLVALRLAHRLICLERDIEAVNKLIDASLIVAPGV